MSRGNGNAAVLFISEGELSIFIHPLHPYLLIIRHQESPTAHLSITHISENLHLSILKQLLFTVSSPMKPQTLPSRQESGDETSPSREAVPSLPSSSLPRTKTLSSPRKATGRAHIHPPSRSRNYPSSTGLPNPTRSKPRKPTSQPRAPC